MGDPDGTDVERVTILNNLTLAFGTSIRAMPITGWAGPTIIGVTHNGTLFVGYGFDP
jgi:hypothetical protein